MVKRVRYPDSDLPRCMAVITNASLQCDGLVDRELCGGIWSCAYKEGGFSGSNEGAVSDFIRDAFIVTVFGISLLLILLLGIRYLIDAVYFVFTTPLGGLVKG